MTSCALADLASTSPTRIWRSPSRTGDASFKKKIQLGFTNPIISGSVLGALSSMAREHRRRCLLLSLVIVGVVICFQVTVYWHASDTPASNSNCLYAVYVLTIIFDLESVMFIRLFCCLRQLKECQGVSATAQDYESEPHNRTNIRDLCVASSEAELLECYLCNILGNATGKISKYTHATGLPNQTFHNGCLHYGWSFQSCLLVLSFVGPQESVLFFTCNTL